MRAYLLFGASLLAVASGLRQECVRFDNGKPIVSYQTTNATIHMNEFNGSNEDLFVYVDLEHTFYTHIYWMI